MNRIILFVAATATLLMSAQADAQFRGLKDSVDSVAGAAEEVAAPADVSQEAIVQNFVAANDLVHEANAVLLEAFGEKDRAAAYRETASALSAAATEGDKDAMKEGMVLTKETSELFEGLMERGAEISGEGREKYVEGLVLAVDSFVATKGLAEDATAFATSAQQQIKSASMMQKAKVTKKLAAGMFVAKELPRFTTDLMDTLGKLVTFAKSADIPTPEPDEATSFLAAL